MMLRSLLLLACLTSVSATAANYIAYIGTGGRESKGIYAFRFDSSSGKLDPIGLVAEAKRPSFVALHPSGRYLYAVAEANGGAVSAYSINGKTGMLTLLNSVSSKGDGPCYVRVDPTGKNVLVANYSSGSVAVLPIEPDGKLRESASFMQHAGTVADVKRQGGPRAHSFNPSPDNRFAVAADLGLDQLLVYKFDAAANKITPNEPPFAKVAPRSGPRHFAFHPNGKKAYAINEISCTMTAFDYDAKAGVLKEIQTISTLPKDVPVTDKLSTAEVQVHPSGKFVYGSNRGHDSIAVFSVASNGTLTLLENVSTQGKIPRNFSIDPTGSFLLAGNQDSNTIVVFRIDKKSGRLTPTGQTVQTPSPICIKFLAVK
ncbi:MAG: lactonase family protein [Bryobacteraceae bacterium]